MICAALFVAMLNTPTAQSVQESEPIKTPIVQQEEEFDEKALYKVAHKQSMHFPEPIEPEKKSRQFRKPVVINTGEIPINYTRLNPSSFTGNLSALLKDDRYIRMLSELFVYIYMVQPNITKTTWSQYKELKNTVPVNTILGYIYYTHQQGDELSQFSTISTKYGRIYVRCQLDSKGCIAGEKLEVTFSSVSLYVKLKKASELYSDRFPERYNYDPFEIRSIYDLHWLFGDGVKYQNVSHYLL